LDGLIYGSSSYKTVLSTLKEWRTDFGELRAELYDSRKGI